MRRRAGGEPLELTAKQRLLLGRLLLARPQMVDLDELAHTLWGRLPGHPVNGIHQLVRRTRALLGDSGPPFRLLVSEPGGYRLDVDDVRIDMTRFERLVDEGARLMPGGPRVAKALLVDALAIWRGPLLGDLASRHWARIDAALLDDQRQRAILSLNAARLALGEHAELDREIKAHIHEYPTCEPLRAQLVSALDGAGRTAEAMIAYRDAVRDLGGAGPELRSVGDALVSGPALARGPRSVAEEAVVAPQPEAVIVCGVSRRVRGAGAGPSGQAMLAISERGGRWWPAAGDHVLASFETLSTALAAARALAGAGGHELGVSVHVGGLVVIGETPAGPGPARCRRLAEAAHPGQVLLTARARDRAEAMPEPPDLRPLGSHRLADLSKAEQIFELPDPDREDPFPALRTLDMRPHNLPVRHTRFVGRGRELRDLFERMASGEPLTLVGPGGCGKTRLALQVAAYQLGSFEHGAWFVDLSELDDDTPEHVAAVAASALDVSPAQSESATDALIRHLADRSALVVLDNCEQVLAGARGIVARLRAACDDVQLLMTSREPLGIDGERCFDVPPMEFGQADHDLRADAGPPPDSLVLLLERAGLLDRDGADASAEIPGCVDICRLLDGLPLAIELAAAEVATSGSAAVAEAVARLVAGDGDMAGFGSASASAPARQRTLEAAIDWSYHRLSESEQIALRRLAVFRGSFDIEQGAEVAAVPELPAERMRRVISRLQRASMVERSDQAGPRLRLLTPIRAYAGARLREAGEEAAVRERHALAYRALAERTSPQLFGSREHTALKRLEAENDNLRAALGWHVELGLQDGALRLVGSLWWLWFSHGHLAEGCEAVERALAIDDEPSRARVRALRAGSHLSWWRGDYGQASAYNADLARCADAIDDDWGRAWAPMAFGAIALLSDPARARELLEESRARFEALRHPWEAGYALQVLAGAHWFAGDLERARRGFNDAVELFDELQHGSVLASVMRNAGLMDALCGDRDRGTVLCQRALQLSRAIDDPAGSAQALNYLGTMARHAGDMGAAARMHGSALRLAHSTGELWATCWALDGLAGVARSTGEPRAAGRLLAFTERLASRAGYRHAPGERELREQDLVKVADLLEPDELDRVRAEGELLSLRDAVESALAFESA